MHARLWRNPIYATIFIKYLLAQPVNFKSERYDETRVLTLRTQQISNLLSPMLLKISAFQCAVYAINVSITNALPPESWETPVQHKLFQYNMTYKQRFLTPGHQGWNDLHSLCRIGMEYYLLNNDDNNIIYWIMMIIMIMMMIIIMIIMMTMMIIGTATIMIMIIIITTTLTMTIMKMIMIKTAQTPCQSLYKDRRI